MVLFLPFLTFKNDSKQNFVILSSVLTSGSPEGSSPFLYEENEIYEFL
jgi:hypothetical protein